MVVMLSIFNTVILKADNCRNQPTTADNPFKTADNPFKPVDNPFKPADNPFKTADNPVILSPVYDFLPIFGLYFNNFAHFISYLCRFPRFRHSECRHPRTENQVVGAAILDVGGKCPILIWFIDRINPPQQLCIV
jgi:hypothetical protein